MSQDRSNPRGGRRAGAGRKPKQEQQDDIARFNRARADKERALADLRSMEAATRAGELIPAAEVQEAVTLANAAVAQALLSLPDTLELTAGLTPAQAETAERVIHAAMSDLANRLAHLSPPNALGADGNPPELTEP